MTRLSRIKKYINALKEIDEIVGAMKNLSFIEINKLNKYLKSQHNMQDTIVNIGADFLTFFPKVLPEIPGIEPLAIILIGSERGFCGNFNDVVISEFQKDIQGRSNANAKLIVVGEKLADKMQSDFKIAKVIPGPSITDEIPTVISLLLDTLREISSSEPELSVAGNWDIIFHEYIEEKIQLKTLNLLKQLYEVKHTELYSYKPVLNIPEKDFFFDYLEYYLFTYFYYIFYNSFISENDKRLRHLENAKSRLEKKCEELTIKSNLVRQEEITEEIENILLGVDLPKK